MKRSSRSMAVKSRLKRCKFRLKGFLGINIFDSPKKRDFRQKVSVARAHAWATDTFFEVPLMRGRQRESRFSDFRNRLSRR
jgi:hypothetical protein